MRIRVSVLVALLAALAAPTLQCPAQGGYTAYHRAVNTADSLFLIADRPGEAFRIYDRVAARYDFVFVQNFFNAVQMACAVRDTQRLYRYLEKCFQNGLTPADLSASPLLAGSPLLRDTPRVHRLFRDHRRIYDARINPTYRSAVYKLFAEDQVDKQLPRDAYYKTLASHMTWLIRLIEAWGFPSDRTIGIDDPEQRVDGSTLAGRYRLTCRDRQVRPVPEIGRLDRRLLASTVAIPFLLHHPVACTRLAPRLPGEIEKGTLHPRDAALLYDNLVRMYSPAAEKAFHGGPPPAPYFKLNAFREYPASWRNDLPRIDSLRRAWAISSVRDDSVKTARMKQLGFYSGGFGFWSHR